MSINISIQLLNIDVAFVALLALLIVALVISFLDYATSTTRVFGLLLLSVVVVILWLSQTYFMLVYLVYILAFISAVLMLFIGVVLMLPLSMPSKSHRKSQ